MCIYYIYVYINIYIYTYIYIYIHIYDTCAWTPKSVLIFGLLCHLCYAIFALLSLHFNLCSGPFNNHFVTGARSTCAPVTESAILDFIALLSFPKWKVLRMASAQSTTDKCSYMARSYVLYQWRNKICWHNWRAAAGTKTFGTLWSCGLAADAKAKETAQRQIPDASFVAMHFRGMPHRKQCNT